MTGDATVDGPARHVPSSRLHHAIIRTLVDTGAPPTTHEMAAQLGVDHADVVEGMHALAAQHGVVLHPHRPEVWVAHPFATAPTVFTVRHRERTWWGNCAWCSLGVAALVGPGSDADPITITTVLGGEDRQVTLRVVGDRLLDGDYVVHFPVPMRHAWDNVLYTCSVMLLFASSDEVDRWCRRHHIARGDVRDVDVVWRFARAWYGRHLDADWRKWTTDEAAALCARFGLDGDIWRLSAGTDRF